MLFKTGVIKFASGSDVGIGGSEVGVDGSGAGGFGVRGADSDVVFAGDSGVGVSVVISCTTGVA